jgi:hypothetical protein
MEHRDRALGEVFDPAWPDAYDEKLMRATATVALREDRLGTIRLPPLDARMAVASHTLLTPICLATAAEGVGTSASTLPIASRLKN